MLANIKFGGPELVGFIVAVSFAAGLNLYATVASLGLLAHVGWVDLPAGLHLLSSWWVIAAAGALFAVEFFADKVPAFDLVWNALHTFVRVPVAALMAYGAAAQLSPEKQLLATLAGGAIALAAHGGKDGGAGGGDAIAGAGFEYRAQRGRRYAGDFPDVVCERASDHGGIDCAGVSGGNCGGDPFCGAGDEKVVSRGGGGTGAVRSEETKCGLKI